MSGTGIEPLFSCTTRTSTISLYESLRTFSCFLILYHSDKFVLLGQRLLNKTTKSRLLDQDQEPVWEEWKQIEPPISVVIIHVVVFKSWFWSKVCDHPKQFSLFFGHPPKMVTILWSIWRWSGFNGYLPLLSTILKKEHNVVYFVITQKGGVLFKGDSLFL